MEYRVARAESMWETLSAAEGPIVLYGTGNGADKIIDALARIGRTPDGVFASDGFVRRRTFRGMDVLSYAEARETFGDGMTVLIAFGSPLAEVMENMDRIAASHRCFFPEVPLYGEGIFDFDYFTAHRAEIDGAYALLSDDASRALYRDMLDYRLRGTLAFLRRTEEAQHSYAELARMHTVRRALDGGAFNGDSARMMRAAMPQLEKILACEPDARTFAKLSAAAAESGGVITPVNCALSDADGTAVFHTGGSRGSGAQGRNRRAKDTEVRTARVDSLCADFSPDLIKLDVEGDESAALCGARETIFTFRPALAVSLYHRTEDLFALPLRIASQVRGEYRYYLRRPPCYPAWDLMLFAVPAENG